jgi:polar amino acid transport system permease protein
MAYEFDFAPVLAQHAQLLEGVERTLYFTALAMALGMVASILGVLARTSTIGWIARVTKGYVEVIRNTPFVVQLFFLYFSLPMMGIEIDANTAALIALVANFAGYGVEILRAGIEAIPRGQIEAAKALGMKRLQIFRKIVLFPAVGAIYPALVGQFILLFLNTSVISVISAEELSAAVSNIQSVSFRSFEAYAVATLIYLLLAIAFRGFFSGVYWWFFTHGRGGRAA